MTRYAIRHVTTYGYAKDVTASYGTHYLRPRDLPWQRCASSAVEVSPEPTDLDHHLDVFGNTKTFFQVTQPHTRLVITATAEVDVDARPAVVGPSRWEDARPADRPDRPGAWRAVECVLESPLIDLSADVRAYAEVSFAPGRPALEAVTDLMHRVHADFEYRSGSTTVTTRVAEVLARRQGVCQDFAQLMIAGLRTMGLAAGYVSGYLATVPPPGRPRLVGADATHAWVSCWLPGSDPDEPDTWVHLDPTNDRLCDQSHATVAWGRDYGDVTPVRGVIYTTSPKSTLAVSVDMAAV